VWLPTTKILSIDDNHDIPPLLRWP